MAAKLGIAKHQLSRSFDKKMSESDLQQHINHLILDFRMDIVSQQLDDLKRQMKEAGSDMVRIKELMTAFQEAQNLRNALARQLGSDVIVIGVVLSWIIIALTLIHVILDNRQPAKTMAWALIILFVPVIGIIFYFFFGVNHRRERLVSQRSLDQLSKRSMLTFVEQQNLKVPETHKQMVDLFVNQSLSLPFKDNFVDIMT